MDRRQTRWVVIAGVGVLALVTILVALSRRQPLPRVAAIKVQRQNLSAIVTTNGKVEAVEPFVLRAELSSFVTRVAATEGHAVHRGELLLELDTAAARAELARARESLISAEEDLRSARAGGHADELAQLDSDMRKTAAELARLTGQQAALERLVAKQAATQDELNQNKAALEKTQAESKRLETRKIEMARLARLNVERAQLQADRARDETASLEAKARQGQLTSPVDGILYLLPVRGGDYVHTGDLLAEVADLKRVRVRAFVDEPDLGLLQPGLAVEITWDALPNRAWQGRTEQAPKTVVPRGTRSVGEMLCAVENEKGELLPNTNVNVRIHVQERQNVLVVPRGAVRSEGSHRYVFAVEADQLGLQATRLRKHEIHVGISSATGFEVLDGLSEGDEVALPGEVDLADGIKVIVAVQE
jgi:HlyD family secretion protein